MHTALFIMTIGCGLEVLTVVYLESLMQKWEI